VHHIIPSPSISQNGAEGKATRNNPDPFYTRIALYLPPVIAAYVLLAMATPLSADFIGNFVNPTEMQTQAILQTGLYAPWHFCMKLYYGFLLSAGLAPVTQPSDVIGIWYFQSSPSAYLLVLALKLPIIIFTLASGALIYLLDRRLGATANRASVAMLQWLANPLVVITVVMWGTWDVVALFFTLISLMLICRGKAVLSGVSLFVAFAIKVIPIILLPVYLVYLYRTSKRGLLWFTATFAVLFAVGAAGALWLGGERLASAVGKVFSFYFPYFAGVTLDAGLFQLSSTVVALSLLVLFAARLWRFQKETTLIDLVLAYLLVFFALAFWHPHYLVYLMAFLAIRYGTTTSHRLSYLTIVLTALGTSLIVFGFYFSSWGHSVLFIPDYTAAMQALSSFILMLPGDPIAQPVGVVLHSLFAAACLYYAAMLFLPKPSGEVRFRLLTKEEGDRDK
jgi:hypothetical protein